MKTILLACLLWLLSSSVYADSHAKPLTVGVVPQFDARKIQSAWQPILDELTLRTDIRFQLLGSPTIPEFEKKFVNGDFDIVYLNPYHQIIANQKQGYLPILNDASKKLFGILVVAKDSPVQSIEELQGQTIAFPAPNALGASLMIRADLFTKFNVNIIPKYVKTHTSVYLNTALHKTSAGGGIMRTFNEQPDVVRDSLKIIYETTKVPPHPISVHPRVSPDITDRLQQAFLEIGSTEAGQKMLAQIPIKKISRTSQAEYTPLESMGLETFYEE